MNNSDQNPNNLPQLPTSFADGTPIDTDVLKQFQEWKQQSKPQSNPASLGDSFQQATQQIAVIPDNQLETPQTNTLAFTKPVSNSLEQFQQDQALEGQMNNFDNFDQPNPIMATMQSDNIPDNLSYTDMDPNENKDKMIVDKKPQSAKKCPASKKCKPSRDRHGISDYTKRKSTPGRNFGKKPNNLNQELARISQIDLYDNPNLNLGQIRNNMISNQVDDENSALMSQISNLNINKKVRKQKVVLTTEQLQQRRLNLRQQPIRQVKPLNTNMNVIELGNKNLMGHRDQMNMAPLSHRNNLMKPQTPNLGFPSAMGRETCPPQRLDQNNLDDLNRDFMIQSQLVEGNNETAFPINKNISLKEQRRLEEEEKYRLDPFFEMKIPENDNDDDVQCDVCLEFEYEDDDLIVICDLCNVAVHQSCYGNFQVPAGNWFCQRCTHLQKNNAKCRDVNCFLCDEVTGALTCVDKQQNIWAHIICVNWTPEIYFTDETKTKISGELSLDRFHITCRTCVKRGQGSIVQCDYKNCTISHHVRCAVSCGMIFQWDKMEQMVSKNYVTDEEYDMPLFCNKHRVIGSLAFREGGKQSLKDVQKKRKHVEKQLTKEQLDAVEQRLKKRKEMMTFSFLGKDSFQKIQNMKEKVMKPRHLKKAEKIKQKNDTLKKKISLRSKLIRKAAPKSSNQIGIVQSSSSKKSKAPSKKVQSISSKRSAFRVQKTSSKTQKLQKTKQTKLTVAPKGRVRHFKKQTKIVQKKFDETSSEEIEMDIDNGPQPKVLPQTPVQQSRRQKKTQVQKRAAQSNQNPKPIQNQKKKSSTSGGNGNKQLQNMSNAQNQGSSFDISSMSPDQIMKYYDMYQMSKQAGQVQTQNQPVQQKQPQLNKSPQQDMTQMFQMYQQTMNNLQQQPQQMGAQIQQQRHNPQQNKQQVQQHQNLQLMNNQLGNNMFSALTQNKIQMQPPIQQQNNPLGFQMGNMDLTNMAQQFYQNQNQQMAMNNNMNKFIRKNK